jgi:hypothetical protein
MFTSPHAMNPEEARLNLRCSIQRALLGEVRSNWAAVTCSVHDRKVLILLFVWGRVSSDDRAGLSAAGAEVVADFPEDYTIEEECRALEDSRLSVLDFWAFLRAEAEPK